MHKLQFSPDLFSLPTTCLFMMTTMQYLAYCLVLVGIHDDENAIISGMHKL